MFYLFICLYRFGGKKCISGFVEFESLALNVAKREMIENANMQWLFVAMETQEDSIFLGLFEIGLHFFFFNFSLAKTGGQGCEVGLQFYRKIKGRH